MVLNDIALGLMLGWISLIILFFVFLLRRFTFNKQWTKENPNPYEGETLGIPRGVLRSVLTLSVLFIVILLEVDSLKFKPEDLMAGSETFIPESRFEKLMTAFQMVIAFYFGGKVMHHVTQAERRVAEKREETETRKAEVEAGASGFEQKGAIG